jgi:hypothetical protein
MSTSIAAAFWAAHIIASAGLSGSSGRYFSAFLTTGRCNTVAIREMPAR